MASAIGPHPRIRLLPARPWLYFTGTADLNAVADAELDTQCAGIDVIWLQGAWEIGKFGRVHDMSTSSRLDHFRECLADFDQADCIGSP